MCMNEKIANYSRYRGVIGVQRGVLDLQRTDEGLVEEGEKPAKQSDEGSLYDAWKDFLATTGPYAYMWTQSFMNPYSDRKAVDALWSCTKNINRAIWGPRWSKKGKGICGTVVAERHKLSHEVRGRLHFHVLVHKLDANVDDERFASIVNNAALWLRDDFARPMSAIDRTSVRTVYDPEGVAGYLTKDLQTAHWPKGDNIFFLRPTGEEGVVFRFHGARELVSSH